MASLKNRAKATGEMIVSRTVHDLVVGSKTRVQAVADLQTGI
ncbi:hypothetical protein MPLB_1870092 [Mesorhizobium sp. ORS 3324]|nr:hypothetical protein MPLB_1870092 [Mesorhizobium sp. ORS 3324]